VFDDTIQPFPSFSEIYAAALKTLRRQIIAIRQPVGHRAETASRRSTMVQPNTYAEFMVEFEVNIPDGTPDSEVKDREDAEATAAARLVDEGHLVRVWKVHVAPGETRILGLYRADSEPELARLLSALPLHEWMRVTVTPLERHPNDPEAARTDRSQS
jgi:muconolactone delta-isomerase